MHDVVEVFGRIRDAATMRRFFGEIFTPTEIRDISLRWELMRRLHAGVPQREIAKALRISLCKITRGAKVLKDRGSVTRNILDEGTERLGQTKRRG